LQAERKPAIEHGVGIETAVTEDQEAAMWTTERVMKKLLLTTVGFAALGMAPVVAADLPMRTYTKAPVPAPVLTWGGLYVGVEAGGGASRDIWSFDDDSSTFGSADGSGAIGGGVIGYNWQLPNNLVLGIEGNFDAADIKGTSTCLGESHLECHSKLDSLYSATGRVGYAALGPLVRCCST
jgi:outer membrane immunogenic protein